MRLSSVHPGDIVECNVRGDLFFALVTKIDGSELELNPISRGQSKVRIVTARQVRAHWRRSGRRPGNGDAQGSDEEFEAEDPDEPTMPML